MSLKRRLRQLVRDRSGVAMVEFALIMPFFLTFGLWGVELANYSVQTMRVGQLAVQVADNASRIGDYSTLQNRQIFESDINDLLLGANLQAGTQIDLLNRGRVIVSSLEVNSSGKQFIAWQRCLGAKRVASSYGRQGSIQSVGMGPAGSEVSAPPGDAVMFVEIQYDYEPMVSTRLLGSSSVSTISSISSFAVRTSRDLRQVYQTTPTSPVMTCDKFTNKIA
jgi:Flp pilus assembly protein TadG